jgi:hypothetical protein
MKRMLLALDPIWRIQVGREIEKRGHENRKTEQIRMNSLILQQSFAICLMIKRGQICNSHVAPADFLRHCKENHKDDPTEDRRSITKVHTTGIIIREHLGIRSDNFCSLTTNQRIEGEGKYKYDHPYMTWVTRDISDLKNETLKEEKKKEIMKNIEATKRELDTECKQPRDRLEETYEDFKISFRLQKRKRSELRTGFVRSHIN